MPPLSPVSISDFNDSEAVNALRDIRYHRAMLTVPMTDILYNHYLGSAAVSLRAAELDLERFIQKRYPYIDTDRLPDLTRPIPVAQERWWLLLVRSWRIYPLFESLAVTVAFLAVLDVVLRLFRLISPK